MKLPISIGMLVGFEGELGSERQGRANVYHRHDRGNNQHTRGAQDRNHYLRRGAVYRCVDGLCNSTEAKSVEQRGPDRHGRPQGHRLEEAPRQIQ